MKLTRAGFANVKHHHGEIHFAGSQAVPDAENASDVTPQPILENRTIPLP